MNVIFKDGDGNEVGRVGNFDSVPRRVKEAPIVLKDEHGRIIYEYAPSFAFLLSSYIEPALGRAKGSVQRLKWTVTVTSPT